MERGSPGARGAAQGAAGPEARPPGRGPARGVDGGAIRRAVRRRFVRTGRASRAWAAPPRGGRGAGHCRRSGRSNARNRSLADRVSGGLDARARPTASRSVGLRAIGRSRFGSCAPDRSRLPGRAGTEAPRGPSEGRRLRGADAGSGGAAGRRPEGHPEAPGDAGGSHVPGAGRRSGAGFRRCPGPEAPGDPEGGGADRGCLSPGHASWPDVARHGRAPAGSGRPAPPASRPGAGHRRARARPRHPRRGSRPGGSPPRWPPSSGCSMEARRRCCC